MIEFIVKKLVAAIARMQPETRDAQTPWLHELTAAVSLARTSKLMGEREEKIVLAAAHLSSHIARDIMIPVKDISAIYVGSTLSQALVAAHLDMHTRFPICMVENDPQTIERYLNFKDIVSALRVNPTDPTIKGISRPITKVREDMPLPKLLEMMIQEKTHIVIVVSADNAVLGMITLEDIIEELVGEIEDEFDRLPDAYSSVSIRLDYGRRRPYYHCRLEPRPRLVRKIHRAVSPHSPNGAIRPSGPLSKAAENFDHDGLRITPRKFRRKKLQEAIVSLAPPKT